jgi:hypothetical protein
MPEGQQHAHPAIVPRAARTGRSPQAVRGLGRAVTVDT